MTSYSSMSARGSAMSDVPRKRVAMHHRVLPDGTRELVQHEPEELALDNEGLRRVHKVQTRRG